VIENLSFFADQTERQMLQLLQNSVSVNNKNYNLIDLIII